VPTTRDLAYGPGIHAAEAELRRVRAGLAELRKALPWDVGPLPALGWRPVELLASPAWTAEQQTALERLLARERELEIHVAGGRALTSAAAGAAPGLQARVSAARSASA
jgi:hypothetical protein